MTKGEQARLTAWSCTWDGLSNASFSVVAAHSKSANSNLRTSQAARFVHQRQEFEIELPDEVGEKFLRVGDIVDYLRERKLID
jgi:hypothetical protein